MSRRTPTAKLTPQPKLEQVLQLGRLTQDVSALRLGVRSLKEYRALKSETEELKKELAQLKTVNVDTDIDKLVEIINVESREFDAFARSIEEEVRRNVELKTDDVLSECSVKMDALQLNVFKDNIKSYQTLCENLKKKMKSIEYEFESKLNASGASSVQLELVLTSDFIPIISKFEDKIEAMRRKYIREYKTQAQVSVLTVTGMYDNDVGASAVNLTGTVKASTYAQAEQEREEVYLELMRLKRSSKKMEKYLQLKKVHMLAQEYSFLFQKEKTLAKQLGVKDIDLCNVDPRLNFVHLLYGMWKQLDDMLFKLWTLMNVLILNLRESAVVSDSTEFVEYSTVNVAKTLKVASALISRTGNGFDLWKVIYDPRYKMQAPKNLERVLLNEKKKRGGV